MNIKIFCFTLKDKITKRKYIFKKYSLFSLFTITNGLITSSVLYMTLSSLDHPFVTK